MPCRACIAFVFKHLILNQESNFATTDPEQSKTNLKVVLAIFNLTVLM